MGKVVPYGGYDLTVTALNRLVPVYPSLDQALAHLPVAPAGPPVTRVVSSRRTHARPLA